MITIRLSLCTAPLLIALSLVPTAPAFAKGIALSPQLNVPSYDQRLEAQRRYTFMIDQARTAALKEGHFQILAQARIANDRLADLSRRADALAAQRDSARAEIRSQSRRIAALNKQIATISAERDNAARAFVALVDQVWALQTELVKSEYRRITAEVYAFNRLIDEPDRKRAKELMADGRWDEAEAALATARTRTREEWLKFNSDLAANRAPNRLNLVALLERYREDDRFLTDRMARGERGVEARLALWNEAQTIAPDDLSVMTRRAGLLEAMGKPEALALYQQVFDRAGKDDANNLLSAYWALHAALERKRLGDPRWSAEEIALGDKLLEKMGRPMLSRQKLADLKAGKVKPATPENEPDNYFKGLEQYGLSKFDIVLSPAMFDQVVGEIDFYIEKGKPDMALARFDRAAQSHAWLITNPLPKAAALEVEADWYRAQAAKAWIDKDIPTHWKWAAKALTTNRALADLDPANVQKRNLLDWEAHRIWTRAAFSPYHEDTDRFLTRAYLDSVEEAARQPGRKFLPVTLEGAAFYRDVVWGKLPTAQSLSRRDETGHLCRDGYARTGGYAYAHCVHQIAFDNMHTLFEEKRFAEAEARLNELAQWRSKLVVQPADRLLDAQQEFYLLCDQASRIELQSNRASALPALLVALQQFDRWYKDPGVRDDQALDHKAIYLAYVNLRYRVAAATGKDEDWNEAISSFDQALAAELFTPDPNTELEKGIAAARLRLNPAK